MKIVAMLAMGLLVAAATLPAQIITGGERDRALSELHASRKAFLDSVSGLSEAQWKFKAAPDRWSVGEVAEHIALSEDLLFGLVQKTLQTPATPEKKELTKGKDELVLKGVADRSQKFQAPEPLRPSGRWATQDALLNAFKESRDRTLVFVNTTKSDLRAHVAPHPALKELDAYQWILLIAAHTQRHTDQIKEVKADAGYPKR